MASIKLKREARTMALLSSEDDLSELPLDILYIISGFIPDVIQFIIKSRITGELEYVKLELTDNLEHISAQEYIYSEDVEDEVEGEDMAGVIITIHHGTFITNPLNFNARGYLYNQPWKAYGPIELDHNSLLKINLTRYPVRFKGMELEVHREGEAEDHVRSLKNIKFISSSNGWIQNKLVEYLPEKLLICKKSEKETALMSKRALYGAI
jgi:hypothetical protein